ncbi:QWRF motif-containing protein 3 [Vicia villosa]|uniref:QWRF motif-containing protein 3 n=1 Tax=Vicia villosa TaxID=3911 RepID=UPI00273CEA3E|nr:QWRF motif-containing protein 3 [Vicia villosa]
MKTQNTSPAKLRQHRNREIASRYLPSPSSSIESTEFHSPKSPSSVIRKSSIRSSEDDGRNKITEESVLRRQLWPSRSKNSNSGTLADHITEERIIEENEKNKNHKTLALSQKSYREFRRFGNDESRENGGSVRYTGKFVSSSSLKKPNSNNGTVIVPGRFSLDKNMKLLSSKANSSLTSSLDTESSDEVLVSVSSTRKAVVEAPSRLMSDEALVSVSPARKSLVEVPSRFISDAAMRRSRRGASDSNIGNLSGDLVRPTIKRTNSITAYKSSKSQWALSPGRSEISSSTKAKGVEKLINFGFDLFKSKKPNGLNVSSFGFGNNEDVHKLRLLDNRLIQWRYANAKAGVVNGNISHQAENNLISVWDGLTKFRNSVMKKKIQFAREKLEMKIVFILYYQLKLLETWGSMERQHVSIITSTKECLHSVVCRVPILEGAKVNIQSTSIAIRHVCELTASMKSILTSFSPAADKTAAVLSDLAKVVTQERQLLEEFYDLLHAISVFQLQDTSVKCSLIQFEGWKKKYQLQQSVLENKRLVHNHKFLM